MLEREGRVWFRRALSDACLKSLDVAASIGGKPGERIAALDNLEEINALAAQMLPNARPVRVIAFNKTEANNWTLPWHQDRVIALRKRVETPGFTNWTNKAGIWHAEPPIELLGRMLFARIHLDPAGTENGCLQLALGTHAQGKIAASDAEAVANAAPLENGRRRRRTVCQGAHPPPFLAFAHERQPPRYSHRLLRRRPPAAAPMGRLIDDLCQGIEGS